MTDMLFAGPSCATPPDVGIGTVRAVSEVVTIEVESATGRRFTGKLHDDTVAAALHPGDLLLVAFDPAVRERLSLPDDMIAVRAASDRILLPPRDTDPRCGAT